MFILAKCPLLDAKIMLTGHYLRKYHEKKLGRGIENQVLPKTKQKTLTFSVKGKTHVFQFTVE